LLGCSCLFTFKQSFSITTIGEIIVTQIFTFSALRASFAIGVMAMGVSVPAQAIVYDFVMTGGAQPPLSFASEYFNVEVSENTSTAANDVLFKLTNHLPAPTPEYNKSTLWRTWFDFGSHTDLFLNDTISFDAALSSNANFVSKTPTDAHPFLQGTMPSPEYKFEASGTCPDLDCGVNNGDWAVYTATLDTGKSFTDVVSAVNQGITSTSGLRVGIFTFYRLGGPSPGVASVHDDAAHIIRGVVPVPEAETWAMLLAGLGLTGFMVRRRRI
jgi:hypothetical protein